MYANCFIRTILITNAAADAFVLIDAALVVFHFDSLYGASPETCIAQFASAINYILFHFRIIPFFCVYDYNAKQKFPQ
jgi:endonuclease IV